MQKGIFRGIENGVAKIEYEVMESDGQIPEGLRKGTRILAQEIAGKIHCVQWGFGMDPIKGWPHDAYPAIGQEVEYESETPDMAGHMVAWIGPMKEAA